MNQYPHGLYGYKNQNKTKQNHPTCAHLEDMDCPLVLKAQFNSTWKLIVFDK